MAGQTWWGYNYIVQKKRVVIRIVTENVFVFGLFSVDGDELLILYPDK